MVEEEHREELEEQLEVHDVDDMLHVLGVEQGSLHIHSALLLAVEHQSGHH